MNVDKKNTGNDDVCVIQGGTMLCSGAELNNIVHNVPSDKCEPGNPTCTFVSQNEKNHIRDLFLEYYGEQKMVKIKNNAKYGIYAIRMLGGTLKEDQFLAVVEEQDHKPIGFVKYLSAIKWSSLQTRKIKENFNTFGINNIIEKTPFTSTEIYLSSSDPKKSTYRTKNGYPLIISLLNRKLGETNRYNSKGTIHSALNTFNCVVTFG